MSQLIQMRERIKTIDTIKKITHAMRLISMSSHSQLKTKKIQLEQYQTEILKLYALIYPALDTVSTQTTDTSDNQQRRLAVLISSQKGLCGNFNTRLFGFIEKKYANIFTTHDIIVIGKKGIDYVRTRTHRLVGQMPEFAGSKIEHTATWLSDQITGQNIPYTHVTLFGNWPKTFFNQKPSMSPLLPIEQNINTETQNTLQAAEDFLWEENPQQVVSYITQRLVYTKIYTALLDSLIAEQAARFIAMDSSTRNATKLQDVMKLQYNKLRQAKITRELTDLISSF